MHISLLYYSFLIECLSILTCLVRLCYTILLVANLLSPQSFIGSLVLILNSSSSFLNQNSSHIHWVTTLNFVLMLSFATIVCFLLILVTRFSPTNVKGLEVDIPYTMDLAQLTSINASPWICSSFLNHKHFPWVFLRYCRILYIAFKCPSHSFRRMHELAHHTKREGYIPSSMWQINQLSYKSLLALLWHFYHLRQGRFLGLGQLAI